MPSILHPYNIVRKVYILKYTFERLIIAVVDVMTAFAANNPDAPLVAGSLNIVTYYFRVTFYKCFKVHTPAILATSLLIIIIIIINNILCNESSCKLVAHHLQYSMVCLFAASPLRYRQECQLLQLLRCFGCCRVILSPITVWKDIKY